MILDLSDVPLVELLTTEPGTVLAAAVRRVLNEAAAEDRSDVVSAFNAHVDVGP